MLVESKKNKKAIRKNPLGRPKVTCTSPSNGGAKIQINTNSAISNLQQLLPKYNSQSSLKGLKTDIRRALGLPEKEGASDYGVFVIEDNGTSKECSIRISNHNANAGNYEGKESDTNISIKMRSRVNKNTFKPHKDIELMEYTYFDYLLMNVEQPIQKIILSIIEYLSNGIYNDKTGVALQNTSPQQVNNDTENNQEIKENKNMNKKTSFRLFERIAGEKGMNDAEVMRRRNDNFIKDMDSVPNSLWDNPYEPNYGDSVETNGWFETPEETQFKVAKDRLKRHRSTQNHKTNNEEIKENRNMNKKQTIRLNEQQLRQIVTESVKKVLNENKPPFLDSEFATGDHERCASYRITSVIREFTLKLRQAIIDDEYSDNIDKMFVIKIDQAIRKVLTEYGIPN